MNKRGSLFHISKRDTLPLPKALAIRGGIILLALVFCGLITTLLTGENPINVYGTILKGAFGTVRKSWVTWQNVAILLGISLAVTPAFKMRFWNIGAEGQTLIGCLASAACMITLGKTLPNALLILVSLVAALLAGALWGFLPAFFKAHWNTNETLFTLMMNYIATQLTAFFIIIWEVPKGAGKIGIINQSSEAGWLPRLANQQYLLPILVIAIMTGLMYVYLQYSKHGYEIAVVGESQRTASYAGIKVDHHPDHGALRRYVRPHRLPSDHRRGSHPDHYHRGRPRLHRRHGVLDVQVQPLHYDRCLPAAGGHGPRRQRGVQRVRPEPLLRRHPDRYHPVLHHRHRVLHHLQGQPAQEQQEGGVIGCFLSLLYRSSLVPSCRVSLCCSAAPVRS